MYLLHTHNDTGIGVQGWRGYHGWEVPWMLFWILLNLLLVPNVAYFCAERGR